MKFVFLLLFNCLVSRADIGSTYGFGSSTAALVGSNRSLAYDGFALDRSPSLMTFLPTMNSYGLVGAKDFFQNVNDVQIDNSFTGGSSQTGNVDTDVPDTMNFLFGSVWALGKSEKHYHLGLTFSAPVDKVTEPQTNNAYQPQYSGYLADSQRLTLSLGFSGYVTPQLSLGLGVNYYFLQAATYQARMPPDSGSGKTSTSNLKMTVKPALAPVAGLTWSDQVTFLTLYYAAARDHKLKMRDDVSINIIGGSTAVRFDTESSLFYDPETFSLGYALKDGWADLLLSVDYEKWSRYDGGYMKNTFDMTTFRQYPVNLTFKDIFVGRAGLAIHQGDADWRLGLGFRPSPHPDLEGESNYIDPDRWMAGLGYGFPTTFWHLFDENVNLDLYVQGHYLVPKDVRKNDSTAIGSPGYKVGGYVLSYGFNLTVGI